MMMKMMMMMMMNDDDLLIITVPEFGKCGFVGPQILLYFVQYGMLISVW